MRPVFRGELLEILAITGGDYLDKSGVFYWIYGHTQGVIIWIYAIEAGGDYLDV